MSAFVAQATDYGVWGDVVREQKTDESLYRYGYQGQFAERDEETGWNHFEAREYDIVTGRWLTTDPIDNGWSPYSGMNNAPIYYVDPDGRCPKCPDPGSDPEIWTTGTSMTFTSGVEYILVDPSLGRDGWVRNGGTLDEIVVTPSFGDNLVSFGAGIANPIVDVF